MPAAKLFMKKFVQVEQSFGKPDGDYLLGRAEFSLEIEDVMYDGLSASVKQTVGADIKQDLEIGMPQGYDGPPFNYEGYRGAMEDYSRRCLAPWQLSKGSTGFATC